MAAAKIMKVNGGDAFIEVGENYVRIGVGTKVFLTLDQSSISGGGDNLNLQMSPDHVTYQGILANIGVIGGLSPVGPKYNINMKALGALANIMRSLRSLNRSVGL